MMTNDFIELHGDRRFADDPAIVTGTAKINNIPVVIAGHQKVGVQRKGYPATSDSQTRKDTERRSG